MAAEDGHPDAQWRLGLALNNGQGAPRDRRAAAELFVKAAAVGHRLAQNSAGAAYRDGQGVERDPVEAYKWFALAASTKLKAAEENMAQLTPTLNPTQIEEGHRRAASWAPPK